MGRLKTLDPRLIRGLCTLSGILLYALSLDLFLVGNNIAAGGLSGVAVVLKELIPLSVGLMVYLLNAPILIAALLMNGWRYAVGAIVGASLYSGAVELLSRCPTLTDDPLVAAVFGGVIYGAGMAMLTFGNGSTGGTDLLCRLCLKKIPGMSMGKMSACIDGSVILLAMLVFGNVEVGLYALVTMFLCSVTCDKIILGFKRGCICMIITARDAREIAMPLMEALGRGVTCMDGRGMYSDSDRNVLLVAVRRQEILKVKAVLQGIDKTAFVMLLDANEMIGGNFHGGILSGGRP